MAAMLAGGAAASPTSPTAAAGSDSPFAQIAQGIERDTPAATADAELVRRDRENHAAFLQWQRDFARASWEWHLHSTQLLMYVVLVIVIFGLYITYLQFTHDRRPRRRTRRPAPAAGSRADAEPGDDGAVRPSTLKLGPQGLELTSQVIGLLVLGLSLAFFYFYIKDVYPMQELELRRQTGSAAASPPPPPAGAGD